MPFDYVSAAEPSHAVTAVYYAIRALSHRFRFAANAGDVSGRALPSDLSPEAARLLVRVQTDIERSKKKPIDSLNRRDADTLIRQLDKAVEESIRRHDGYDLERGRALLDEMRRDHATIRHRAAG